MYKTFGNCGFHSVIHVLVTHSRKYQKTVYNTKCDLLAYYLMINKTVIVNIIIENGNIHVWL